MAEIKNYNSFIQKRIGKKSLEPQFTVSNLKNERAEVLIDPLKLGLFKYCRSYENCMRNSNFQSA